MKNLKYALAGFLLLGIVFSGTGQTQKGKLLVGGGSMLNFTSAKSKWKDDTRSEDDSKIFKIEFSPQVGYFFVDNWAVGMEIPLDYSLEKNESYGKTKSTSLTIAPFIIHYFGNSNVKPYLQAGFGWGFQTLKYNYSGGYYDPKFNYTTVNIHMACYFTMREEAFRFFLTKKQLSISE